MIKTMWLSSPLNENDEATGQVFSKFIETLTGTDISNNLCHAAFWNLSQLVS